MTPLSPLTGTAPDRVAMALMLAGLCSASLGLGFFLGWLRGYERGTLAERDARVTRACQRFSDAVALPPNASPFASRSAVSILREGIATPATIDSFAPRVRDGAE